MSNGHLIPTILLIATVLAAVAWLFVQPPLNRDPRQVTLEWDPPGEGVVVHVVVADGPSGVVERRVAMPATRVTLPLPPGRWTVAVRACTADLACSSQTTITTDVE